MNIEKISTLTKIWEGKNWQFPTPEAKDSAFNRLCNLLSKLDDDEQDLFINLTKSYSLYSLTEYSSLQIKSLNHIDPEIWLDIEKVIFMPLVNPKDSLKNKVKSGHALGYSFLNYAQYSNMPKTLKIEAYANPTIVREEIQANKILVIMVDDFIGSGLSAEKAVLPVKKMLWEQDKLIVLSLVTMQQGIDYINKLGIPMFYAEMVNPGIKNNPYIADKAFAYKQIDEIWKRHLEISEGYKRGYEECEALVTLIRTPNNTLPMYWVEKSRDGSEWPAPFSR